MSDETLRTGMGIWYCNVVLLNCKQMYDIAFEKTSLSEGGQMDQFIFLKIITVYIEEKPNL